MSRHKREALDRTLAVLAARYLRSYERAHRLDRALLRRWQALHLIDGWGHAIETIGTGSSPPTDTELMGLAWARNQFELAMA